MRTAPRGPGVGGKHCAALPRQRYLLWLHLCLPRMSGSADLKYRPNHIGQDGFHAVLGGSSSCRNAFFPSLPTSRCPGSVRTYGRLFAMATEIHQVGSEAPPLSEKDRIDEKNTAISEDIEGNSDEESKRLVADRAEATELTPVEAFKWNVEGDQSPCRLSRIPLLSVWKY